MSLAALTGFKVLIKHLLVSERCSADAEIRCKSFFFFSEWGNGGEGRHGEWRGSAALTNKSRMLHACTLQPLPPSPSPKSNSLWHKKGEFVLMFVENWGNKLDRDLANQNSLQKLSDPGGSRALDKQDWLFQKHAYITPIWVGAITRRQLGENKPDSDHNCLAGKQGEISRFSLLKWETFLIKCSGSAAWQTFTVSWVKVCRFIRDNQNCCISFLMDHTGVLENILKT